MNLEKVKAMNKKIEEDEKIRKEVREIEKLSTIEILKHFKFLPYEREQELKEIDVKVYKIEDWEFKTKVLENVFVDPKKIVGTYHSSYNKKNLFLAVNTLKRAVPLIQDLLINPDYYIKNESRINDVKKLSLAYRKHTDEYFICSGANHRFLISKAINLKKVLVNRVIVYEENLVLKKLLAKIRDFGFDYSQDNEQIILESEYVKIRIYGFETELEAFLKLYENLSYSKWNEKIYKIKCNIGNRYQNKYAYSKNEVKHIFHYNFLRLIKHKRQNIL